MIVVDPAPSAPDESQSPACSVTIKRKLVIHDNGLDGFGYLDVDTRYAHEYIAPQYKSLTAEHEHTVRVDLAEASRAIGSPEEIIFYQ